MAGACTGPGPCDVHPLGHGKNWVTKAAPVKGLGPYIRAIAHALERSGHSEQEAIRLAVGIVRRWAHGEGKVTPATRARAEAALAHWERLRAKSHAHHLAGDDRMAVQLAARPQMEAGRQAPGAPEVSSLTKAQLIRMAKIVETWPAEKRGPAKAAIAKRAKALGMKPDGDGDYDYDVPALNSTPGGRTSTMMAQERESVDLVRRGKLSSAKDLQDAYRKLDKVPPQLRTHARAVIVKRARKMASMGPRHLAAEREAVELGGPPMAERRRLLAMGQAMPPLRKGGPPRYPISDAASLHKAIKAVGLGKTGHPAIRRYIMRVAAKLGLTGLIPEAWKS